MAFRNENFVQRPFSCGANKLVDPTQGCFTSQFYYIGFHFEKLKLIS